MASVNWQKIKSVTEMKAMLRHDATEPRLQTDHSNKQINKELTGNNLDPLGYEVMCDNFDERLAFLDAQPGANKRRDRVVGIGLEIPIPNEIPDDRLAEYANGVHKQITDLFGEDNVIGGVVHVDEVHDYYDPEKKYMRTSMRHIHEYAIPVVNDKLCCDKLFRKANLYKLNKAIDDFTRKEFGCRFLTGEKTKSEKSVEQLKNESRAAEIENSLKQKELIYEQKTRLLQAKEESVNKREKSVADQELTLKRKTRLLQEKEESVNKRERSLDERESALKARESAVKEREENICLEVQRRVLEQNRARSERSEAFTGQQSINKNREIPFP